MKVFKLGIVVLAVVIVFTMISCGESGNGNGDTTTVPLFSVSGQFASAQLGGGNVKFQAKTEETVTRSARSSNTAYDLSGELEDGDMLLRLTGSFDSADNSYTISAAASFLRYTVNGNAGGATATVAVKDTNDVWTTHIVSVTVVNSVNITAEDDSEDIGETGGLPEWALGSWEDKWKAAEDPSYQSFEAWSYFTPWYYEKWENNMWRGYWEGSSTRYTVIEVEEVSGETDVYDVIFAYPRYTPDETQLKAAAESFLTSIGVSNANERFWPYSFAPWELPTVDPDTLNTDGTEKVWWYICMDENRPRYGEIIHINWDVFVAALNEIGIDILDEDDAEEKFYGVIYNGVWDENTESNNLWTLRDNLEEWFEEKEIGAVYYWGWFDEEFYDGMEPEDGLLECMYWEPAEDWETFYADDAARYFIRWVEAGSIGFQGDWDRYDFAKWWTDDYLNKYLVSQNVPPETWYTKVRISWDEANQEFLFQYYDGRNDSDGHHSAPPCDSQDLDYVKNQLTYNDYRGYSNLYKRERSDYRYYPE